MKAIVALEDGTVFEGASFGAEGEAIGELIFNTQVVGFQEIITDPAYFGKLVCIGYPHVGNVGINDRAYESDSTHASALIVKEYSKVMSNWQAREPLGGFMKKNNVIGIEGIDTRALTVHIREKGEMRAIVSTKEFDKEALVKKAKTFKSEIRISKSSRSAGSRNNYIDIAEAGETNPKSQLPKSKTIIINLGVNNSTLAKYPEAKLVSHKITAEKVLENKPEQVVISSGPGDPRELTGLIEEVKKLIDKIPIYGIQNGACVLAQALGCTVYKMKVGHHGVNYPVVDPKTGKGEISAQNHSYGIEHTPKDVKVIHVNLNDKTIEKIESKDGSCVASLYFPIDERGKLEKGYRRV